MMPKSCLEDCRVAQANHTPGTTLTTQQWSSCGRNLCLTLLLSRGLKQPECQTASATPKGKAKPHLWPQIYFKVHSDDRFTIDPKPTGVFSFYNLTCLSRAFLPAGTAQHQPKHLPFWWTSPPSPQRLPSISGSQPLEAGEVSIRALSTSYCSHSLGNLPSDSSTAAIPVFSFWIFFPVHRNSVQLINSIKLW